MADPLDEVCPTCKAIPGHPCRDTATNRTLGLVHPTRHRKAQRRGKRGLNLTPLEIDMLLKAVSFAQAGEWPWEPYKKREGKALESAANKIASLARPVGGRADG